MLSGQKCSSKSSSVRWYESLLEFGVRNLVHNCC